MFIAFTQPIMKYPVDSSVFFHLGLDLAFRSKEKNQKSNKQSFDVYTLFFGLSPEQTSALWDMIDLPKGYYPIHILWALAFLKLYWTEVQLASLFGVMEKTLWKRVWFVVSAIAKLQSKVVCLLSLTFSYLFTFAETYLSSHFHRLYGNTG